MKYTPVVLIGTQAVNGTNYAFLCETSIAAPGSQNLYAIVCLYEDGQKNVSITDVNMSGVRTYTDSPMGGWTKAPLPTMTKDLTAMVKTALSGVLGANYTPIALLSTQSGLGTNYCFLCESGKATADPNAGYAFIYVYDGGDGEPVLSQILDYSGQ